ncbi:putative cupredoxin [Medicago truncatula]|uniref:Plastocyanin-like domain protein n=1 Tax=Medicago truncatula TaxID=3880 RepID=I3SLL8_MEDTR|nr:mavicyanin [Medicago truncatula]AFK41160.1 unknown [Medicago truncatula]KEH42900.1 plastocyanin-like domain protein [Medicago truncatula]RHN80501.1 putative cupredoxin [Medicago truncatula]
MASHNNWFLVSSLLLTLLQIQTKVFCYQFKVGDLNAWGIPTSANPQVYAKWSKFHNFTLGDSLLFLYPPSQDSLIQVTQESYKSCNTKDPILYMNNGNSLFNITSHGDFYFTSGENGHCQKNQKIHISVGGTGNVDAEANSPSSSLPASAPSSQTVFGSIPVAPSSSNSPHPTSTFHVFIIGSLYALFLALM